MKALPLILAVAVFLALADCSNPAVTTVPKSVVSYSPFQAAYSRLDVSSPSAWQAAVSSGDVRQGTILIKTGPTFDPASLSAVSATQTGAIQGLGGGVWRHLSVAKGTETATILALRSAVGVQVAEPEMVLHFPKKQAAPRKPGLPFSSSGSATQKTATSRDITTSTVLNDPFVASAEYSLTITHAIEAYTDFPLDGTKMAYAAVIDTGINMTHQDFNTSAPASIVVRARSAFTRNSASSYTYVGDQANGYTPGSATNFVDVPIGSNWDDDGHGTHVAGIIGALGNNGDGGAGVMWKGLKLISYKVLTDNEADFSGGSGSDWAVYGALADLTNWWATGSNHPGTQVTLPVNMSLGGYYASSFEAEMISYGLQNNVVIIAAMGNDGRTAAEFPAAYSGVIAVGATDGNDQHAIFSTSGNWISVSAPGVDIISTYNGSSSDYQYDSGTSMATPFVTGLSAYALAFAPTMAPDQLKTVLMNSADYVAGNAGFSNAFGAGRVNVLSTLQNTASLPDSGSVYSNWPITITVTVSGMLTQDIPVYLYDSLGNFIEVAYSGSDGTVSFWLLKPSAVSTPSPYHATANNGISGAGGKAGSVDVNLPAGASAPATGTIAL